MIKIRPLQKGEEWFLREMLYEAIFIPANERPLPESIVDLPELSVYIADFGRKEDICYVAELNETLVGAAWSRLFSRETKGYGFVDEQTPEVSMAVQVAYRGQGVGTRLLEALQQAMQQEGYAQVSLSVDKRNRAVDLYKKIGFQIVGEAGSAYTMVKKI